ncbi:MAG TPA: glycosyltransferase [Acidimicrobiales bacterium]|nr:glycosyltransferase [Acidimicrobiales bacterium]
MDPQAPPVVAVVVTADPGEWFEETLGGLAAQDYPNLSVLVVDAGSTEDPTPRVAAILPGAYVRRLPAPTGYAAAANEALRVVEGASFYLLCHDDVALDRDAVRLLVEEAFRSNAGIIGPKLVTWEDPSRILQVGMSADKGGLPVPLALPGELDQEQHDSVRDVFVAPDAAMLVRADLFAALGGFDAAMVLFREDVDLSWRAQTVGARVMVAPAARARHRAALSAGLRPMQDLPGLPPGPRRGAAHPGARELALCRRHELRAALKCYGRWHLVRVAPQLAAHSLTEATLGRLGGHAPAARAAAGAWVWNLRRLGELRRLRSEVAAHRVLPDGEVRRLQSPGGARLTAVVEGLFSRASTHVPHLPPPGGIEVEEELREEGLLTGTSVEGRPALSWAPLLVWGVIALALLFGARSLLHTGPPAVGQMAPFPSVGRLLSSYASSTRPVGLGQTASAPLGTALVGVLGGILGGSAGLARTLAVVGMLPVGAVGAYRLARPLGSRWAGLAAPVAYLALPLPYEEVAHGRWAGLVAYGAAPWLLRLVASGTGLEPFVSPSRPTRRWAAAALVLALGAVAGPGLVAAALVATAGMVLASGVAGGWRAGLRGAAVVGAGAVGAWLLAFPWSAGLFTPGGQAAAVLGLGEAVSRAAGPGALLGFHAVPGGTDWIGWVLLPAMAVPVLFGRAWRLEWGLRMWGAALACWVVAWASGRGWLGGAGPDPAVLLGLAGAALALAAALGVVAFQHDLTGHSLGWRQAVSVIGVAGVTAAALGALGQMGNGRWRAPSTDFRSSLAALAAPPRGGSYRVLWVGDPAAVPVGAWQLRPGVGYGTATVSDSGGAVPDVTYQWPPPDPGALADAAADLTQVEGGRTVLVGRDLAVLGIRYVVVPDREAPDATRDLSAPAGLVSGLADQLDLRPVPVGPGLHVYEDAAWRPGMGPPPPQPSGGARAAELALETLLWLATVGGLVVTRPVRQDQT